MTKNEEHSVTIGPEKPKPRRKAEYVLLVRHDSGPNEEGNTLLQIYSVELNKCASQTELIAAAKKAGMAGVYTIAALYRTIAIKQTERMIVEDVD